MFFGTAVFRFILKDSTYAKYMLLFVEAIWFELQIVYLEYISRFPIYKSVEL